MPSYSKASRVEFVAAVIVGLGALAMARPAIAGWLTLIGFGGAGFVFLIGAGGIARRRTSVAFGVYMLVFAVKFGTGFGGPVVPRWFALSLTPVFFLAVAWCFYESRQDRAESV